MRKTYGIVLYIRISVEAEDSRNVIKDESNSIPNHRDLLHAYAKSLSYAMAAIPAPT